MALPGQIQSCLKISASGGIVMISVSRQLLSAFALAGLQLIFLPASLSARDFSPGWCGRDAVDCADTIPRLVIGIKEAGAQLIIKIEADYKSESWNEATSRADTLDILAKEAAVALTEKKDLWSDLPRAGRMAKTLYDSAVSAQRGSLEMRLVIADKALKSGCLDTADAQYRNVLQRNLTSDLSGYARRAQVGVDDIRDIRSRKSGLMCSWFHWC
jgi:hypothetical protein